MEGTIEQQNEKIPTDDGVELAATTFSPDGEVDRVIVLNSAVAMPRRYYAAMSKFFADAGYGVVTYDYRGIGDSGPDDLVGYEASVTDWAEHDTRSVLTWARRHFDADTLIVFGHSLGGQIMGLLGDRDDIDVLVTFAAQTGYWKMQAPGERLKVLFGMRWIYPALTHLCDYLPWGRIFSGEDLPKEAALQWASWCTYPNYLLDDETLENRDNFERFTAPIIAYSADDDHWGHRDSVDWMMNQFTNAPLERIHLVPEEVGVEKIGHLGFFRPEMSFLWEEIDDRLREQ